VGVSGGGAAVATEGATPGIESAAASIQDNIRHLPDGDRYGRV
jgi:hypothetical protein